MKNHIVSPGIYIAIFLALMVGTALTVYAAFIDMGALNNFVALGIAVTKAMLVVAFFMHLKYAAKIVWAFAAAGVVFFIIMMTFLLGDYQSRPLQYRAQPWEAEPVPTAHAHENAAPAHH